MTVRDVLNDAGLRTGFEISNFLLSRRRACRIAARTPGATITRWPRRFAVSDDAFCAFSVDGIPFLIIEPFGDNHRYWVVAAEPSMGAQSAIDRARSTFESTWG